MLFCGWPSPGRSPVPVAVGTQLEHAAPWARARPPLLPHNWPFAQPHLLESVHVGGTGPLLLLQTWPDSPWSFSLPRERRSPDPQPRGTLLGFSMKLHLIHRLLYRKWERLKLSFLLLLFISPTVKSPSAASSNLLMCPQWSCLPAVVAASASAAQRCAEAVFPAAFSSGCGLLGSKPCWGLLRVLRPGLPV